MPHPESEYKEGPSLADVGQQVFILLEAQINFWLTFAVFVLWTATDFEIPTLRFMLGKAYHRRIMLLLSPIQQWLTRWWRKIYHHVCAWKIKRRTTCPIGRGRGKATGSTGAKVLKFYLLAHTVIATAAQADINKQGFADQQHHFDVNSYEIGIDSRASGCMTCQH